MVTAASPPRRHPAWSIITTIVSLLVVLVASDPLQHSPSTARAAWALNVAWVDDDVSVRVRSDDGGGAPAWLRLLFATTFLPDSCILMLEWSLTYTTATGQVAHTSSLACGTPSAAHADITHARLHHYDTT